MRIVIDLQGAQTASRFRGIGRYAMALAQAMARNAGRHEIWLVLNNLFPETIEPIRLAFEGAVPQERIRVFELPGPIAEISPTVETRARVAELIREAFIASLKPDVIHVMSLFEGFVDDASVSVKSFDQSIPTAVTLYDLIPLMRKETTFASAHHKNWYFRKLLSLKRSDLLLAISAYSRQEGLSALQMEEGKVVNISTAIDGHFHLVDLPQEVRQDICRRFGIPGPFILYTGGCDERKNLDRLIEAYAKLPKQLREKYSLVFAGKMSSDNNDSEIVRLKSIAQKSGLTSESLVFTGYVTDEDLLRLYNLCHVFVFPSLHEGFGLPPLEAMACGAVTIGSNRTSIPEVIGLADALFDPEDTESMTGLIFKALTDEVFREEMRRHGLEQVGRFSWDQCAKTAIKALECLFERSAHRRPIENNGHRFRLAYVSPLPPEKSGIADYSVELLPELAKYYDIEVISDLPAVECPWITSNYPKRTVAWFGENSHRYDRVLYQIGNSPFHAHMFDMLQRYPGIVTLHDFFLSSVKHWIGNGGFAANGGVRSLYEMPQGYGAVQYLHQKGWDAARLAYPCNADVFHNARGIIVHSPHNLALARQWFGDKTLELQRLIPLVHQLPAVKPDRESARSRLGISADDFVVCSFGFLDPSKLNHRLLESWIKVATKLGKTAKLYYVGANCGGEYGKSLEELIEYNREIAQIQITGHVPFSVFEDFLVATDVAVQLRAFSRGESSKTILDCLAYGVPTIINDHGTLADYPDEVVNKLGDNFTDEELISALHQLCADVESRKKLGQLGREYVRKQHHPAQIGALYYQAVEHFYAAGEHVLLTSLVNQIGSLEKALLDGDVIDAARCISVNHSAGRQRELLIDISSTARNDLKTGIERVVRAILMELISNPPEGYRVEPVYLINQDNVWHYRYARKATLEILKVADVHMEDTVVDPIEGDVLIGLDIFTGVIDAEQCGLYQLWRNRGVSLHFVVYDLLPILHPEFFPPGIDKTYADWLGAICRFSDGLTAISKSVADELIEWLRGQEFTRRQLSVGYFHLGADIDSSAPTKGIDSEAEHLIEKLGSEPTFLMVGTIEPRKGHLQTIAAFELLWTQGLSTNLVIVGKEGWQGLPHNQRRTIPEIVEKLNGHAESGVHLFWLQGVSDEYLEKIYAASTCLIAASEGEGFGLPLVEAAQHGLPIIARDIPVFREVAGDSASYFSGGDAHVLATALHTWMKYYDIDAVPKSGGIEYMNWRQSATQLIKTVLGSGWYRRKYAPSMEQKAMDEHLQLIHKARLELIQTHLPPADMILDLGGANSPLHNMGYPHRFTRLTMIDLPPEGRHEYYKDVVVDSSSDNGQVVVHFGDMTQLESFSDESIDLVWSGQSIEHVSPEAGQRMCREAFRVLRHGGSFCLDTPNRLLTAIHTKDIGGGFIHPEHSIEYTPEQLKGVLEAEGFHVVESLGVCEMPETVATGKFHYADFLAGQSISDNVDASYIQYFHCVKP